MKHKITYTAIAAACLTLVFSAQAQQADDKRNDDGYQTLDKVVVTAQKREQAALDVPAAVTALNAERLERSGFTRLEDYAAQVPGMSITALSRGSTSVVLRGISTGISQATPSTAFYIDEAPIGSINAYATGSTMTPDLDPYDLKRIEVLKGPQGTLYGAGAVGGLVRYVSQQPSFDRFGGSISLGYNQVSGGGDGGEARAALNIPLADHKMAFRISVMDREDAGYIDNPVLKKSDVNKASTRGGRVAMRWDLSNDWQVQAWGQTQRFKTDGIGAVDLVAPALTPKTGDLTHSTNLDETQHRGLDVLNATVHGNVGELELVSSTTWQHVTGDTRVDQSQIFGTLISLTLGIPNVGASTNQFIDTKRLSQELRLRGDSGALQYEGGVFLTKEDSSNSIPPENPFSTLDGSVINLGVPVANARINSTYKEASLFGNVTYSVTKDFDLLAGLRFAHNNQHYVQDYKLSLLTAMPVLIDQSVSNSTTTYLLGGLYRPAKGMAIYARMATGYRPGGPSALPPGVVVGGKQSFEPDTLTSTELGFKADLLGGKASIEAAVFNTDWKDVQIQTNAQTAAGSFNYFVNGGKARSRGAELTLTYAPARDLTLRMTTSSINTVLTEDAPAAGGVNGDRMPFVPHFTASFSAEQRLSVAGYPAWIGASFSMVGSRISNFSNKTPMQVPGYNVANVNGGVDIGGWRVSAYVKNLMNERGINHLSALGLPLPGLNPLGNPYAAGVIQPRTIGMDLAYKF